MQAEFCETRAALPAAVWTYNTFEITVLTNSRSAAAAGNEKRALHARCRRHSWDGAIVCPEDMRQHVRRTLLQPGQWALWVPVPAEPA